MDLKKNAKERFKDWINRNRTHIYQFELSSHSPAPPSLNMPPLQIHFQQSNVRSSQMQFFPWQQSQQQIINSISPHINEMDIIGNDHIHLNNPVSHPHNQLQKNYIQHKHEQQQQQQLQKAHSLQISDNQLVRQRCLSQPLMYEHFRHEHIYCNQEHLNELKNYHRNVQENLNTGSFIQSPALNPAHYVDCQSMMNSRFNCHATIDSNLSRSAQVVSSQGIQDRHDSGVNVILNEPRRVLMRCIELYYKGDDSGLDWNLLTAEELQFCLEEINNLYQCECQTLTNQFESRKREIELSLSKNDQINREVALRQKIHS